MKQNNVQRLKCSAPVVKLQKQWITYYFCQLCPPTCFCFCSVLFAVSAKCTQPLSVFAVISSYVPSVAHCLCLVLFLAVSADLFVFLLCAVWQNVLQHPPFFLLYVLSLLLPFTAHVNLLLTKGIISFRENQFWKVFICFSCSFAGWQNAGRGDRQRCDGQMVPGRKRIGTTGLVLSHWTHDLVPHTCSLGGPVLNTGLHQVWILSQK